MIFFFCRECLWVINVEAQSSCCKLSNGKHNKWYLVIIIIPFAIWPCAAFVPIMPSTLIHMLKDKVKYDDFKHGKWYQADLNTWQMQSRLWTTLPTPNRRFTSQIWKGDIYLPECLTNQICPSDEKIDTFFTYSCFATTGTDLQHSRALKMQHIALTTDSLSSWDGKINVMWSLFEAFFVTRTEPLASKWRTVQILL